jgi:S-adenosylmethionine:tRNA ribosyltransferase-isomerase
MTNPKHLSIHDFTYTLPEECIAKYPLAERDDSKLLIYKNGKITETVYKKIADQIPESSLLVFNNTKVVEARLLFQKPSGGVIEIFCLQPHEQYHDITTAMLQTGNVLWQCLVGGASKWKHGQVLEKKISKDENEIVLQARFVEKRTEHFIIELSWSPATLSFAEILHHTGAIPLPPYIKRAVESSDAERYQTVYAHFDGSVAAPTAGLHFTTSVFEQLASKKIKKEFVTLHVGAGTFKPVKSETMDQHEMHAEFIDVSKTAIENIRNNLSNNVIAVGTTSLRTVESLYWLGVKLSRESGVRSQASLRAKRSKSAVIASEAKQVGSHCERNEASRESAINQRVLELSQWEPYELQEFLMTPDEALNHLLTWMNRNKAERLVAKTQIIIAPGYKFNIATALITNFHQPQSTLLLLVAALVGEKWKEIYDYALANDFRFLSYGDGSLLWGDNS